MLAHIDTAIPRLIFHRRAYRELTFNNQGIMQTINLSEWHFTFDSDPQRVSRVKKQFKSGKPGH